MVYRAESQPIPGLDGNNSSIRRADVEVTASTAQMLEMFTQSSEGQAVVVTSSRDVQKIQNPEKLKTIFVIYGPMNSTDNGLSALDEIRQNPNFSQMRVVFVSEYRLNPQTTGMYVDRGATDVIEATEIEPSALQDYIDGKSRQLSSAA